MRESPRVPARAIVRPVRMTGRDHERSPGAVLARVAAGDVDADGRASSTVAGTSQPVRWTAASVSQARPDRAILSRLRIATAGRATRRRDTRAVTTRSDARLPSALPRAHRLSATSLRSLSLRGPHRLQVSPMTSTLADGTVPADSLPGLVASGRRAQIAQGQHLHMRSPRVDRRATMRRRSTGRTVFAGDRHRSAVDDANA